MSWLFLVIMGSAAKLRGVFEAKFCSAHKHIRIMVPLGPLHHVVSGTFSHLDGVKIIYILIRVERFLQIKLRTQVVSVHGKL